MVSSNRSVSETLINGYGKAVSDLLPMRDEMFSCSSPVSALPFSSSKVASMRQPVISQAGDSGIPTVRYAGLMTLLNVGLVASVSRD